VNVQVTRNIIQDLLPLYLAGEACQETRALVDEFLARDPALAAVAASHKSGSLEKILAGGTIMPLPQDHEAEVLARTRVKLQRTVWILALAIAFTLVPFSFTLDHGHITWVMVRDVPRIAWTYWALAVGFWIAYFVRRYQLRSVGL
jgi:anti-sigma factor RsiW